MIATQSLSKEHLSQEELAYFLDMPEMDRPIVLVKHLTQCLLCQKELEEYRGLKNNLKTVLSFSTEDVVFPRHLSDQKLNDFIYGKLDSTQKEAVEHHVSECDICLKSVMRLKTHMAQQFLDSENDKSEFVFNKEQYQGEFSITPVKQSYFSNNNFKYSIAASVFLIAFGFFMTNIMNIDPLHNDDITVAIKGIGLNDDVHRVNYDGDQVVHGPGVQNIQHGTINWYAGYLETKAIGTADMKKMVNPIQAEVVAKKTARHIAYAQLAEMLNGVQVTQQASYKDLLVVEDALTIANEQFIKGARISEESFEWIKGSPKATVTMILPLHGDSSLTSTINKHAKLKSDKATAVFSGAQNKSTVFKTKYTDVIFDLQKTSLKPALFLTFYLGKESSNQYGAHYYNDMESALNTQAKGFNPYIVKAEINSSTGQIQIEEKNYQVVNALLKKSSQSDQKNIAVLF